jgi:AcrR family transcriptional regulator
MTEKALRKKNMVAGTARELFAERGYQQVTMEDIAVSLGMARSTLYDYFRSKEEILYALIEQHVAGGSEPPPPGLLPHRLAACMAASLRRLATNFDLYRILFAERPVLGNELGERLREWQGVLLGTVRAAVREAIAAGEYKPRGGQEAALFVYQALLAQRLNSLLLAGPESLKDLDPEAEAGSLVELMLHGTGGL